MRSLLVMALLGAAVSSAASGPPLHTNGRYIVDRGGARVKLAAVNWYGAEEQDYVVAGLEYAPLADIARRIRAMGFNTVRLPWSNEMYESNPAIAPERLTANPALKGLRALDVFDAVIAALAAEGLYTVLDNHVSIADWCCSNTDGNGFWYNGRYPESSWIADWRGMARRYADQPFVIGADLRNEPRGPVWGGDDPRYDWRAAAERAGNAILDVNPNLLIIVEGVNYAADLTGVRAAPVRLNLDQRLVYSSHDYSWFHNGVSSYAALKSQLDAKWGFLLDPAVNVPVWVGEFGTCHTSAACVSSTTAGVSGFWFSLFTRYAQERDLDWAYWALNGTEATGSSRTLGAEETYGILKKDWTAVALPALLNALQAISSPSAAPAISPRAVVNSATSAAGVAVVPGSLVTVYGTNLAPVTALAESLPLPLSLGGAAVRTSDGRAVPIQFASPTQMNVQLPWELDVAVPVTLRTVVGSVSSDGEPLLLAAASPAIYKLGDRQGAVLVASTALVAARSSAALPNARPVHRGEYLSIFATGLGKVQDQPATGAPASVTSLSRLVSGTVVTIGNATREPAFAGLAPGLAGVYQIDVQVPPEVVPNDAVKVSISVGGVQSNVVEIAVE